MIPRVLLGMELRGQVRTRRLLVMAVVLTFFGLASPLIAKSTPMILEAVSAGKEGVTISFPPPALSDALLQFVKNLSQFGALLAILLGMSSVAGEKDHGRAVFTLSRPVRRSHYLLAKFAAQAFTAASGMIPAAVGCYLYSALLFRAPSPGSFLVVSGMLFLFILVFTAMTLLASTLGRNTAAAAGFAFGGAVVLLVLGFLPGIGDFAPGSLVAAANGLARGEEVSCLSPILGSVFLLLLFPLLACLLFERQEI